MENLNAVFYEWVNSDELSKFEEDTVIVVIMNSGNRIHFLIMSLHRNNYEYSAVIDQNGNFQEGQFGRPILQGNNDEVKMVKLNISASEYTEENIIARLQNLVHDTLSSPYLKGGKKRKTSRKRKTKKRGAIRKNM